MSPQRTFDGLILVEVQRHPPDSRQLRLVQRQPSLDRLWPVLEDEPVDRQARKFPVDSLDGPALAPADVDEHSPVRVGLRVRFGHQPREVVDPSRDGHPRLHVRHALEEAAHPRFVLGQQLVEGQVGLAVREAHRHVVGRLRLLAAVLLEVLGHLGVRDEGVRPAETPISKCDFVMHTGPHAWKHN